MTATLSQLGFTITPITALFDSKKKLFEHSHRFVFCFKLWLLQLCRLLALDCGFNLSVGAVECEENLVVILEIGFEVSKVHFVIVYVGKCHRQLRQLLVTNCL